MERRSSAVTLSDMEIFIFPELIYSLVLANLMSPRIWAWRADPWFKGGDRAKPYRRITRLKQYIMDHYVFNLDLDTWGLTTKQRELARFRAFVDEDTLARSNALFGYEGDKYYFDIGIRQHFGLDKYEGNVIPYWKTETVEAMDAFRHKDGYSTGAGECVSLATLYAAALFAVARIPLKDIFLMATPLHSQNFVDVDDGILTNNRRLVTKNMWFNGTALSAQARRALEHERVTVVAHETGCVHTIYPAATIERAAYERFAARLRAFLLTGLTVETLGNFLRHTRDIQQCFQVRWPMHGHDHFVALEKAFAYEQGSSYLVTDATREKLMAEVDMEEFVGQRMPGRIVLNELEDYLRQNPVDLARFEDIARMRQQFVCNCMNAGRAIESLIRFCRTEPRLPDANARTWRGDQAPLGIDARMGREEVLARLESIRARNRMADLAFYAYRDANRTELEPFLVAAVQRSPVAVGAAAGLDLPALAARIEALPAASIYDGPGRLAQPDEVWNFGRGDGAEKAILLAALARARRPDDAMTLEFDGASAVLKAGAAEYRFVSAKALTPRQASVPGPAREA